MKIIRDLNRDAVDVTESKSPEFEKTVRILIRCTEKDTFTLQKGESDAKINRKTSTKSKGKIPEDMETFFADVEDGTRSGQADIHGERVYYMPDDLLLASGIRFLLERGLLLEN